MRLPPQTPALGPWDTTSRLVRVAARATPERSDATPLVTCIMPTSGRPAFARNAVRLFLAQDYPRRELVVVDDRPGETLERSLPADPRVRVIHAGPRESIGAKRNRACAAAAGDYIAHWDDDDWYGPHRLSAQLEPLRAGRADVSALRTPLVLDLAPWRFWSVTPALHRALFSDDVHGGTLVYRRDVWERRSHYPDASLAEDAAFLLTARRRGARLERMAGDGLFVYVRHGRNAWHFRCGEHVDPAGWLPAAEPPLPPADRAFLRSRRHAATGRGPRCPLVSCIMPTRDRRHAVGRALAFYERQSYRDRELVVLDDGADPVRDLMPADTRIRYVRLQRPLTLGEKRNAACALARGVVIVHWDDDDWSAPDRIGYQVEQLQAHGAQVCGPARLLCFDPVRRRAWLYEHPLGPAEPWVAGSGLCYLTASWRARPFEPVNVGEDAAFIAGRPRGSILALADHRFLVALVHDANTSPKLTSSLGWRSHPLGEVQLLLGADYARFERTAPMTPNPVATATNAPQAS